MQLSLQHHERLLQVGTMYYDDISRVRARLATLMMAIMYLLSIHYLVLAGSK